MSEKLSNYQKAKRVIGVGFIGVVGIAAVNNSDIIPDCVSSGFERDECLPDINMPEVSAEHQAPAEVTIGDLEKEYEDQSGTVEAQVYGEVTVGVGGSKSKVDYDEKSLFRDFAGDVDATNYWNRNGNRVQRIIYNPCIRTADDYRNTAIKPIKSADESKNIEEEKQASPVEFKYVVDVIERGPNAGFVNSVTIDAGYIDACFARQEVSAQNSLNFEANKDNQRPVGKHEDATFRWMIESLTLAYAQAEACPEEVVDVSVIRQSIKELVLGRAIANNPEMATKITDAFENGRFVLELDGPEARRAFYRQELRVLASEISAMDRSFPNEEKGGKTYPLDVKLGDFAVTQCEIVSDIEIVEKNSTENEIDTKGEN